MSDHATYQLTAKLGGQPTAKTLTKLMGEAFDLDYPRAHDDGRQASEVLWDGPTSTLVIAAHDVSVGIELERRARIIHSRLTKKNAPVRMTLIESEWGDWSASMYVITPAGEYERRCTRDGSTVYTDFDIRRALNTNGEQGVRDLIDPLGEDQTAA